VSRPLTPELAVAPTLDFVLRRDFDTPLIGPSRRAQRATENARRLGFGDRESGTGRRLARSVHYSRAEARRRVPPPLPQSASLI